MSYDLLREDDVLIARLTPEISPVDLCEIQDRLRPLLLDDIKNVVLDLGPVGVVSSTFVGQLIRLRKQVAAAQGRVYLVQVGVYIRKVIRTLGLEEAFQVADTEEDALEHLRGEGSTWDRG